MCTGADPGNIWGGGAWISRHTKPSIKVELKISSVTLMYIIYIATYMQLYMELLIQEALACKAHLACLNVL